MTMNAAPVGRETDTVTIANGTSLSPAIDLAGHVLLGIVIPAAWTAANVTFQVSADGVTYGNYFDSTGTEITVIAAAGQYLQLSAATFVGVRFAKIRSGTNSVPVNQGSDRILTLVGRVLA